ncbi:glycosyltransferase family 9 protein [Chitinophaga qingshengii]|uniref:Glycosyltransferase family 9 protein n=1 Tax=Chitinophaga qingshengii TaxID=1569794 RepID=A0ABR7TK86_9BACT|nr:glycosyltransferase family 9 protein [Chitinophaga qingshengii]MBC9929834.1 glycosyltransferase family 9 protein [Chitinophaga qingshengii]
MLQNVQRIIMLRALKPGDLLCTVPAFRALRLAYPKAHITLAGLPCAGAFQERFSHYIDTLVHFPGYPGLPEQEPDSAAFAAFMQQQQQVHYDLALQMQGNGSIVNDIVRQWKATYTAGFVPTGERPPGPLFINYPERLHEINRHLHLLEHTGIPATDTMLEFPLTSADKRAYDALALGMGGFEYICIHPGASVAARQWPPAYFAAIADYLASDGWKIILTGTAQEKQLTAKVKGYMRFPVIDLAGGTSLGCMAQLIRNSRALVCNCTAISHIAAAMATPSLVISMDGEPHRWAPLNHYLHRTIDWTQQPTMEHIYRLADELMARTNYRQPSFTPTVIPC